MKKEENQKGANTNIYIYMYKQINRQKGIKSLLSIQTGGCESFSFFVVFICLCICFHCNPYESVKVDKKNLFYVFCKLWPLCNTWSRNYIFFLTLYFLNYNTKWHSVSLFDVFLWITSPYIAVVGQVGQGESFRFGGFVCLLFGNWEKSTKGGQNLDKVP